MTTPPPSDVEVLERPDSGHKTIVRLIAGGIGEGFDRLLKLSEALDDANGDPASTKLAPIHADPTLMSMLGWLSELPAQVRSLRVSAAKVTYPVTRTAGVLWNTGADVAQRTGATAFAEKREPRWTGT